MVSTYSSILFSDSQLTSPDEAVCVGEQVVFDCQQTVFVTWTVDLPGISNDLTNTLTASTSPAAGTVLSFTDDPGYNFELNILPSSSATSVRTEVRVTARRELDGVTVECNGDSGSFMSTINIQIAAVD